MTLSLFKFGNDALSRGDLGRPHLDAYRVRRSGARLENPVSGRLRNFVEKGENEIVSAAAKAEKNGTPIVIRGDEVSFLEAGTGKETVLPDDFLVVQDVSGKILRTCDLYFLRNQGVSHKHVPLTAEASESVEKWYGDGVSIDKYRVDLPNGDWQRVAKIDGIRYRREGDLAGPYEHPYDPPVVLFRSTGAAPAWRVVHPDGCIIDERGIVHP
jgi:hypothetical protein